MRNCVSRSTRKVGLARRKVAWERDPDECRESRRKISLVSFPSSYLLANLVLVSSSVGIRMKVCVYGVDTCASTRAWMELAY